MVRDTSADRQFDTIKLAALDGASEQESVRQVVDLLIAETKVGVTVWRVFAPVLPFIKQDDCSTR